MEGGKVQRLPNDQFAIVPEGKKEEDITQFYNDSQNIQLYDPRNGEPINKYYKQEYSIGTTDKISDGLVVKYKDLPLMVRNPKTHKLVLATPENLEKFKKHNKRMNDILEKNRGEKKKATSTTLKKEGTGSIF
jgi:hypothetical protein